MGFLFTNLDMDYHLCRILKCGDMPVQKASQHNNNRQTGTDALPLPALMRAAEGEPRRLDVVEGT